MALIKKKTKEEKVLQKERERIHKEMVHKENEYRKEDKIAPKEYYVSLQHINKIYDNHIQAVYDFNLDIKPKEFIVFVGPSGCGKSTTLRMIAGLEDITYGDLYIGGNYCNDLQPKDRNIAMVFQSYALYPHMTVYDNIAFGLKIRHEKKQVIDKRVREAARILDLTDYLDRKPNALSGGQCQRVALGRAIVRNSKLFLMDEPLSNLDAKLRVQMRSEIVRLHHELETTTIYVTHDQTEAMTMASRIVVMNKGHIQQIGTPKEIYNHPANMFVASFIGSPAMNIFKATYDNGTLILNDDYKIKLTKENIEKHDKFYGENLERIRNEIEELTSQIKEYDDYQEALEKKTADKSNPPKFNDRYYIDYLRLELKHRQDLVVDYEQVNQSKKHDIMIGIRPEDIIRPEDATAKVELSPAFKTKVIVPELLGREYYVHFDFGSNKLVSKVSEADDIEVDDIIDLAFNMKNIHLFDIISTNLVI